MTTAIDRPPSAAETAHYLETISQELSDLANRSDYLFVGYLLAMASKAAAAETGRPSGRRQRTTARPCAAEAAPA